MTQTAVPNSEHPSSNPTNPSWSRYGWLLGREFLLLIGGLAAYRAVRLLVKDEIDVAFANSERVIGSSSLRRQIRQPAS